MPLVPGLSITNAVRDLMAGHLLSGLSKGAEAFLTAFAIGAGIARALEYGDNFLSVYTTNCYREMYHFLNQHF